MNQANDWIIFEICCLLSLKSLMTSVKFVKVSINNNKFKSNFWLEFNSLIDHSEYSKFIWTKMWYRINPLEFNEFNHSSFTEIEFKVRHKSS